MAIGKINSRQVTQITITTSTNITTETKTETGVKQDFKNTVIDNGVNAVNITTDCYAGFMATYLKHGTGTITFVAGVGRTLIFEAVSVGSALMDGAVGSTATISSVGTTDYIKIQND